MVVEVKTVSTTTKWLAGLNSLLGLWLIAAPFVFGVPSAAMWNAVIVGAAIALLAGYNYYLVTEGRDLSVGSAAVVSLLGIWVIIAPFVFQPGTTALWNDVIVGVLVAIFAGYNAYDARQAAGARGQPAETGS